ARYRKMMKTERIDFSIVTEPDSQFYLTGFMALTYSRPIILIIDKEKSMFILPGLEEVHASEKALVDEVHAYYEHPEMIQSGCKYEEKVKDVLANYSKDSKV